MIEITDDHEALQAALSAILSEASLDSGFAYQPERVSLELAQEGRVVGGLTGVFNWNWLYIEMLAVEREHRGLGFAKQLVERAERLAQLKSCAGLWVDTFTFQAPDFYLGLGFEAFGDLHDYPQGQRRIFLRKLIKPDDR